MESLDIYGQEFVDPHQSIALPPNRDQAEQVYAWEIANFPQRDVGSMTLDECRALVYKIWTLTLGMRGTAPAITDGRGSIYARFYNDAIHLPRWARNRLIVIHELAHVVTSLFDDIKSLHHDALYLQIYFTMLDLEGDYKYGWLKQSAKDYGLKVGRVDLFKRLQKYQIATIVKVECQSES